MIPISKFPLQPMTDNGALFSDDRLHRYVLWRRWANGVRARWCAFIGLNPSTADETKNDPTVRRCIQYAKDWGYDGLFMLNAFAFRATDPRVMKAADDPIGRRNDEVLKRYNSHCSLVVAAWGVHGTYLGRSDALRSTLLGLHCLGTTKEGEPKHPLYLKRSEQPRLWTLECDLPRCVLR